jgi:hypothetical protein
MRLLRRAESCKMGQRFTLWPLGDIHAGSANCDEKLFCKVRSAIMDDPDARVILMGDLVESIAPDDPRWNPPDVAFYLGEDMTAAEKRDAKEDWLDRVRDFYVAKLAEMIEPFVRGGRVWSICDGNHEDKFRQRYHSNLTLGALQLLGQTDKLGYSSPLYGEWAAMLNVQFEDGNNHRCSLPIFQQHGWQAGRKKGAKVNSLDDLMGYIVGCRIYLVAHSHERLMTTKTLLGPTQNWDDIVAYDSYGAHTGSFLRTYQKDRVGYGEKKGFPPTSLGPIHFNITPTRKGVEIEGVQ